MGAASTVIATAAVVQAVGSVATSMSQASAQRAQGEYQKQQFESNARLAEIQAEDAITRGDKEAKAHDKRVKVLIGRQRAAMAAQGIDIESGSALDVQMDTAALGAEDMLTIKNNAWREAWGYRVQAQDYRSQGAFAKMAARNQSRNTILTGLTTASRDLSYGAYYSDHYGNKKVT